MIYRLHSSTPQIAKTETPIIKPKYKGSAYAYGTCGTHLGDCWFCVSYCITHNAKNISRYSHRKSDVSRKISEIIPLFGDNGLTIVNNAPSENVHFRTHRHQYARTIIQWKHAYYGRVCYQIDGKSHSSKKNVPKYESEEILRWFKRHGIECTRIGGGMSLKKCVEIAATSDAFFGVESGMSHLCHSVGVPIFIMLSKLSPDDVAHYHGRNRYCLCAHKGILTRSVSNLVERNKELAKSGIIPNLAPPRISMPVPRQLVLSRI